MKRLISLGAIALCLSALPALAATTTVEFVPAEGATVIAVFSDDKTVSFNGGAPVAYKMDEAARTICSSLEGTETCATFETWGTTPGHSTPYTTNTGSSGTATVTAATE